MTVSKLVSLQSRWMVMMLMMVGHTEDASIELERDPPVQAAGYKLDYGWNSRDYSRVIDVGNQTSYTLSGLGGDRGYYFMVTDYDEKGKQSRLKAGKYLSTKSKAESSFARRSSIRSVARGGLREIRSLAIWPSGKRTATRPHVRGRARITPLPAAWPV
jgi:hypothetical protein